MLRENKIFNYLAGIVIILNCIPFTVSSRPFFYNDTPQYRLYDQLFAGYNNKLRPRYNSSEAIHVGIEYELNTVAGLDEVNQVMNTVGFVVAKWFDDFLCWNETDYGVSHFVVPASTVWLPDIGLKNSADTFYDITFTRDFRVDIRHDGRVLWAFGGNFATTCTLDMTYYPFDLQRCEIDIENWAYTNDTVHLYNLTPDVHLQEFSENGEWKLDHTKAKVEYFQEDTHPDKYFPRVIFAFFLTRKYSYYLMNIICPALFVISISLTVFWLPPDSGEKVSLGITVLLAFSVFQLVIMENTPRTSDFTPVMTMLFTSIMGMSTFSVLTSITVLFFHHHGPEKRPPKIVRIIAFRIVARVLCMHQHVPSEKQLVPVLAENKMADNKIVPNREFTVVEELITNFDKAKMQSSSPQKIQSEQECLSEILQHMRKMMRRIEKKETNEMVMAEWKAIALVLDRGFFWIAFIIISIIVPIYLLRTDDSH